MNSKLKSGISSAEFDRIFDLGLRVNGHFCRVLIASGSGRTGISTPKKLGCHARRNRLKRRLRNAVRECVNSTESGIDFVVLGKITADEASFGELVIDIRSTLDKARQLWEKGQASI